VLRFLADEDFDHRILRGLILKEPSLDILTVQQAGRGSDEDLLNLQFAAEEGRVLQTCDKRIVPFVIDRIESGDPMPGVFIAQRNALMGTIVQDLLDLALLSLEGEWEGQIVFLPLG
jgi:hypothetical protein